MSELLAPAGSMEALKAAIANGCDAVYLGMQRFGARAYSSNFDTESLLEAVAYAHLRDVKVYVTMNTIVFEEELEEVKNQLDFLNNAGVDGVIIQDLGLLDYVARSYQDMEAHCSTQMGIEDVEGALACKSLGAKRIVIAREVSIDTVKKIKSEADIPVEIFIHGALCISYSGNCIMSSMTGNRSGNRGRCIGSCRKLYDVIDVTNGETLGKNYILSAKDLNTIDHIKELREVDSLKIEGRMKEPVYVANVVSRYRMALDGKASPEDKELLNRTFNRTFTKGYLFGEDRRDITNIEKPNNYGYRIGTIAGRKKGMYQLSLEKPLKQNDLIRIQHGEEEVNLAAARIYDAAGKLINGSDSTCYIKVKERLSAGDPVFITKDVAYTKELESHLEGEFKRFPLNVTVYAFPEAPLSIEAEGLGCRCTYVSDETLSTAQNRPTTIDVVSKQLSRLNDTVFYLNEVNYQDENAFIPAKMLNEARRSIVEQLYSLKIASKSRRKHERSQMEKISFSAQKPRLCAAVSTQEQYDACAECGIETIYFENIIPRNGSDYPQIDGDLLIGGMGGIQHYRHSNPFVTDYSLNVVNSQACRVLHGLGAKRVTLSYEINERQIKDLVESYKRENDGMPSLEMIVYGHAPLLVTKYCPLKKMGQCGKCRTNRYLIQDEFGSFPVITHKNCNATILNGKTLNLIDEMPRITGIEMFRLNFTIEDTEEVKQIVEKAKRKLYENDPQPAFNPETDTRGHFNREIM